MTLSPWANSIYLSKYSMDGKEEWPDTAHRVATTVLGALGYQEKSDEVYEVRKLLFERKFLPGGRYLYATGRGLHQVNNCLLLRAEDSREGWSELLQKASMALMTGAGIGVDYSQVRESGAPIRRTGGLASGPISLMQMVNEVGRHVMQGGSRRSAIWAGLRWDHPDIMSFIRIKDWSPEVRALKEKDFNFPGTMDMTNVSVILDDEFFEVYHNRYHMKNALAQEVYWKALEKMGRTGEPGFSIDTGANSGETLRNACTELTSYDTDDICNLGSLNLARFDNREDFATAVDLATLFLLAGTVYSHVPYPEVAEVREKNRRLGLGLMGVHEWLLQRDRQYGPDIELDRWLREYATSTEWAAEWADIHSLSRPVKTRAIAPTGTISIVAETTSGIEPLFCTSYKRRYLASGNGWKTQLVVDPVAKRLIEQGVPAGDIEDAYSLSYDVERRIGFQAWMQGYVDHGISSTINLPAPLGYEESVEYGKMLLKYLPRLRGLTSYPNGARGGQPLTPIPLDMAMQHEGVVFESEEALCNAVGVCGT